MGLLTTGGGKDTVFIQRGSERSDPFRCNFASKQVTLFYPEVDVVEGDKLVRELPNGKEEIYTILEVHYGSGLGRIPPHFRLDIEKDSALQKGRSSMTTNHINIHGSTGIQIGDHNVQSLEIALKDVLAAIEKAEVPLDEKEEARNRLNSFLQHPLVVAAVGGGVPAAIGLLS
jgi:hypothetical protein|tara:strand:- start:10582 stop:11100 length:519 start_codon:yes stop_codon:yes gene_type:complete